MRDWFSPAFPGTAARGPVAKQQPLFVSRPDKLLKRHLIVCLRRGRDVSEEASEHPMAELISELEALDQAVAELIIRGFPSMTLKPFAKARNGICQRADVEFHDLRS